MDNFTLFVFLTTTALLIIAVFFFIYNKLNTFKKRYFLQKISDEFFNNDGYRVLNKYSGYISSDLLGEKYFKNGKIESKVTLLNDKEEVKIKTNYDTLFILY